MCLRVVALLGKGFGASLPCFRTFAGVHLNVEDPSTIACEAFVTLVTLVRFSARVHSSVCSQTAVLLESLRTLLGLVGFRMFTHMSHTGLLPKEQFWRAEALGGLVACGPLNVTVQFGCRVERHGKLLALGSLFVTMGYKVAHDAALVCGHTSAETTFEPGVSGGVEEAAGVPQQCSCVTLQPCGLNRFRICRLWSWLVRTSTRHKAA